MELAQPNSQKTEYQDYIGQPVDSCPQQLVIVLKLYLSHTIMESAGNSYNLRKTASSMTVRLFLATSE
jgi:hypothetical protein